MLLPNQNPFRIVSKYQQFGRDQNFPTPGDVAVGWLLLPQGSRSGWPHKMKTGAVWGKSTVVLSSRFWDQSCTLSQIVWWEPQLTVFLPQDLMGYRGFFLTHIIYIYIIYIYILYIYILYYMLHKSPYGILYMNGWVEGVLVRLLPWNGIGGPHDLNSRSQQLCICNGNAQTD